MSQPDFLYELFEDFMDDPANQDFSMDNGLVCRWLTGQAKISPKISVYYSKSSNQKKLAETIHQNLLPLMSDCNMAMQDIYTLFIQDDTISDAQKKNLASLYKPANSRLLFLASIMTITVVILQPMRWIISMRKILMSSPIVHGNLNIRENRKCGEISLLGLRKGHMIWNCNHLKYCPGTINGAETMNNIHTLLF